MLSTSIKNLLAALLLAAGTLAANAAEPTAFSVMVSGQGKPMLLIPGLASSGEVWAGTVAHYAQHYRCHVLNLAGFAGAPAISAPLLQTAEQELVRYIAEQRLDHPVVVGHSLGGFLALRLEANHPGLLGRIVVVDALPALGAAQLPDATQQQLQAMATRMRDGMLQGDAAAQEAGRRRAVASMVTQAADLERVVQWGQASDRNTVVDAMYEVMATDLRQDVARIQTPTLVLGSWIAYQAYASRSAIESNFRLQYARLPGVRIEMSDKARHFIMYDDPQWLHARIDEFLK